MHHVAEVTVCDVLQDHDNSFTIKNSATVKENINVHQLHDDDKVELLMLTELASPANKLYPDSASPSPQLERPHELESTQQEIRSSASSGRSPTCSRHDHDRHKQQQSNSRFRSPSSTYDPDRQNEYLDPTTTTTTKSKTSKTAPSIYSRERRTVARQRGPFCNGEDDDDDESDHDRSRRDIPPQHRAISATEDDRKALYSAMKKNLDRLYGRVVVAESTTTVPAASNAASSKGLAAAARPATCSHERSPLPHSPTLRANSEKEFNGNTSSASSSSLLFFQRGQIVSPVVAAPPTPPNASLVAHLQQLQMLHHVGVVVSPLSNAPSPPPANSERARASTSFPSSRPSPASPSPAAAKPTSQSRLPLAPRVSDLTPACQRVQQLRTKFAATRTRKCTSSDDKANQPPAAISASTSSSPLVQMLQNCCSSCSASNWQQQIQKFQKAQRQEDGDRFLQRQNLLLARKNFSSSPEYFAERQHQQQKQRSSSAPIFRSSRALSTRAPLFAASRSARPSSSSSSSSATPRLRPDVKTTESTTSSFAPQITHEAKIRPRRGAADMARDYVRRQELLSKMRREQDEREKEKLTFTPSTRTYYVPVARTCSSESRPSLSTTTRSRRRGNSSSSSSSIATSTSSELPPLSGSGGGRASSAGTATTSRERCRASVGVAVGSVLSNMDRYMHSLIEREARLAELRRIAQIEKETKELEQCSFAPKIKGVPSFIQRMASK